jgi:hypothetical protein
MIFVAWNIKGLYKAGYLTTASRELSRYGLDLVRVQEVIWEGSGTAPAEHTFLYGNGNGKNEFFEQKTIISAVKWFQFDSDRMSYIILRGCWFHVIVLNVHAPIEDKFMM